MPSSSRSTRLAPLPQLLERKLYKTGQTRGATPSEIYQNRVSRASTVLLPHELYERVRAPDDGQATYENGFIVLVRPNWYFTTPDADDRLQVQGLELGYNALLLFERRADWVAHAPRSGILPNGKAFAPAVSRLAPIGGTYMARIHGTTAKSGDAIFQAFNETDSRGAGIRVYEYASSRHLDDTRLQLEALVWMCHDSRKEMIAAEMTADGADRRCGTKLAEAQDKGLLDLARLRDARMIDEAGKTVCPLCLNRLSAADFLKRGEQAEGRETYDLTITEVSLFHIEELRVGKLQHKPYNLGWGHHFCNVVVKDAGIIPTLRWMKRVLDNNGDSWVAIEAQAHSVEKAVE